MICAKCGNAILSGQNVKYRSKNYHAACLEEIKAAAKAKDQKKASASMVRMDPDRDELDSYVYSLYGLSCLSPLLNKQINDFHTQRGYSYKNILLSLRYFFDILPNNIPEPESPSIGIVPYIYDEALAFWSLSNEANEYNKSVVVQDEAVVLPYQTKPSPLPCVFRMEDV